MWIDGSSEKLAEASWRTAGQRIYNPGSDPSFSQSRQDARKHDEGAEHERTDAREQRDQTEAGTLPTRYEITTDRYNRFGNRTAYSSDASDGAHLCRNTASCRWIPGLDDWRHVLLRRGSIVMSYSTRKIGFTDCVMSRGETMQIEARKTSISRI